MGLLDFFARRKALTASPAVVETAQAGQLSTYRRLGGGVNAQIKAAWLQSQSASYAYMFERQPAVRKVVDYIARNTAQLGLKLYERVSDTERRRDTDHPAALTLEHPNDLGPADQFIYNVVADFLVHDNAYVLKFRTANGGPRTLIQIPPPAVAVNSSGQFLIDSYRIYRVDGSFFDVAPEDVIHWRGYNPSDPRIGISKLETLRQILAEDSASQAANVELLKAGLAKPGYIRRPLEAPEWSQEARKRFQESWANQAKSSPRQTPVLEEGMEFADFGVSPKDAEMLAGRQFTNDEVASLYGLSHCPPEGEEERKQFLADVLTPISEQLACQLDFSILEQEYGAGDYYFEFDLNSKLRGDLESRFAAMTSAAGRPWATVNEIRARENLPAIDGGDELTIPLNVALSGDERQSPALPAPNVMPMQDPNGPPQDGSHRELPQNSATQPSGKALLIQRRALTAHRRDRYAGEFESLLRRFYDRQERSLTAKAVLGDLSRWNAELADDLDKQLRLVVDREGDLAAQRFGMPGFDAAQVRNWVRRFAESAAKAINDDTAAALGEGAVADVFARARGQRVPVAAMSLATRASAFAALEAARQSPDAARRMKTWVVTSENSEHPELDGESVPLGGTFSNGSEGPPADHVGCQCTIEIT